MRSLPRNESAGYLIGLISNDYRVPSQNSSPRSNQCAYLRDLNGDINELRGDLCSIVQSRRLRKLYIQFEATAFVTEGFFEADIFPRRSPPIPQRLNSVTGAVFPL